MSRRALIGVLLVLAVILAGAGSLQARLEAARPLDVLETAELYLRSPKLADRLALSYDGLLADVYWIRAIQHFGGVRRSAATAKRYDLLYPMLDLTTSLDPYFGAAYVLGAIFLAEPHPAGPGRPDLSIKLLERAMRHQPEVWRFPQQAGFICYWYMRDYSQAADWFARGARLPGAPVWLRALEATSRAEGGDLQTSRELWQHLMVEAESDWMRETARFRLAQIEAFAAIDALTAILKQFASETGGRATGWDELIRAGYLRGIPVDPTGVPFMIHDGVEPTLSPNSPLYPLPVRPRAS